MSLAPPAASPDAAVPPPAGPRPRPVRPRWRAGLEALTDLGVGTFAAVGGPAARHPVAATATGLALDLRRRALDLTEAGTHAAGAITRGIGLAHAGAALRGPTQRLLEPWTSAGHTELARTRASASERISTVVAATVERTLDVVDLDAVLDALDVGALLDRVDVQSIIDRVDVERIVQRVDVAAIVDRVDVERIVDRVDVERIVQRVDVAAIVARVDVDAIVERTELGSLIVSSTSGVATEALDVVRSQGVGLDTWLGRTVNRVLRRAPADVPVGPPRLVTPALPTGPPHPPASPSER